MQPTQAIAAEPASTQSSRSEGLSFTTYLISFAVAFVLYSLSPGPVLKFVPPSSIKPGPLNTFLTIAFTPHFFCYNHFLPVRRFYDWYFKDVWHIN